MTQKREGESGDSPSLCHHSEAPARGASVFCKFLLPIIQFAFVQADVSADKVGIFARLNLFFVVF